MAINPRSNSRLLHQHLLRDKAQAAVYLDLYTGDATPEEAVPALTEAIKPHLPITVLVLGMGDDMHTASLFPGVGNGAGAGGRCAPGDGHRQRQGRAAHHPDRAGAAQSALNTIF
jgi:6-phosphogluconolactonase